MVAVEGAPRPSDHARTTGSDSLARRCARERTTASDRGQRARAPRGQRVATHGAPRARALGLPKPNLCPSTAGPNMEHPLQ